MQVCNKRSRQSEHQRSGINLRNLAFCVWEDASLGAHWVRSLHRLLSYLGSICFLAHLASCISPAPQQSPWGWQHPLDCSFGSSHSHLEARNHWWLWPFFLLIWQEVKRSESHSVESNSLWPHGLYSPWNFPGQNTGVGSLSLLQAFFPTQGSNPGLPHCRLFVYQLSHKGSPREL